MLGVFNKAIKSIFGDKATRDLKEVTPLVEQVKVEYSKLSVLDHDGLRARSAALRSLIRERVRVEEERQQALRAEIDADPHMDIHAREARYEEVDTLESTIIKRMEEVLLEILPEAFAMVGAREKGIGDFGNIITVVDHWRQQGREFSDAVSGKRSVKSAPGPWPDEPAGARGRASVMVTLALCWSAISFTMASPSPLPSTSVPNAR